jgi:hypothetical protein
MMFENTPQQSEETQLDLPTIPRWAFDFMKVRR